MENAAARKRTADELDDQRRVALTCTFGSQISRQWYMRADLSSSVDPTRVKAPKVEHGCGEGTITERDDDRTFAVYPAEDSFKVEVKLRSMSKAIRNDPKPAGYWLDRALARRSRHGRSFEADSEAASGVDAAQPDAILPKPTGEEPDDSDEASVPGEPEEHSGVDEDSDDLQPSGDDDVCDRFEDDPSEEESFEDDLSEEDSSEYDMNARFDWMEEMDGHVVFTGTTSDTATRKQVGYCEAKLIRRSRITANFHDDMEEPSTDMMMLAFDLFDRYGRLKPEFKHHPVKKGSGIWNKELDTGDILLIEFLRIDREYRRHRLGKRVINAILDRTREKCRDFFAIAFPTFLNTSDRRSEMDEKTPDEYSAIYDKEQEISIKFFRSLGFRRIGSSQYFGFAGHLGHPSHLLAAEEDYNLPIPPPYISDSTLEALFTSLANSEDPECVGILEGLSSEAPELGWLGTDKTGNSLLHIAAVNAKPKTVDWIMNHPLGQRMLDMRNNEGDTPLESILTSLEASRTHKCMGERTLVLSDKFKLHDEASVLCVARLKGLTDADEITLSRLSSGCTCGLCISGFISPRMRLALLCQASYQYDMLSEEIESGPYWVESNLDNFKYLPKSVCENLKTNKSMRQGFANLCNYFVICLEGNVIPTESNIFDALARKGKWPSATGNFLRRGGTITSVASMLFKSALDEDELSGDGQHREVLGEKIAELPECRNDHEFGFVSGMCGYKRVSHIQLVSARTGEPISDDE